MLDAMLERSGGRPVFATLSEQEVLVVGNEFVNLLVKRFGHADTVALVEGRRMMDAAGILADVERLLERRHAEPLDIATPFLSKPKSGRLPAAPPD